MSAHVTQNRAVSPHVAIAALETALFRGFLVHTAGVTTGNIQAKVMDSLIRQDDRAVFADTDYVNERMNRAAVVVSRSTIGDGALPAAVGVS